MAIKAFYRGKGERRRKETSLELPHKGHPFPPPKKGIEVNMYLETELMLQKVYHSLSFWSKARLQGPSRKQKKMKFLLGQDPVLTMPKGSMFERGVPSSSVRREVQSSH